MRLPPDIAEAIATTAQRWAESPSDLPLIIRKSAGGAVCVQALPRTRYTKGQFAAELGVCRNTFRKVEERFGLEPSPTDGMYSAETVEMIQRLLKHEEKADKITPQQRRMVA